MAKIMTPIHISNRLFSKLPRYFGSSEVAIREVIQNAYRSYCPLPPVRNDTHVIQVSWVDETNTLSVADQGRGIDDPGIMLSPAASEWATDVEHDQDPAGMGVFGILAWCESATWTSRFGTLTVDSVRFFNDEAYRSGLLGQIDTAKTKETGTTVVLHGFKKPESFADMPERIRRLCSGFTRVRCYVDGVPVEWPSWLSRPTTVQNDLYDVYHDRLYSTVSSSPRVSWHGHEITVKPDLLPARLCHSEMSISTFADTVIHIKGERLVTPRLPDRTELVSDERTVRTIREALTQHGMVRLEAANDFIRSKEGTEPPEYSDLRDWFDLFRDVDGFRSQLLCRTGFVVRQTREHYSDRNGVIMRKKHVVVPGPTVDDSRILVVNTETDQQTWYEISQDVSGLAFYKGEDDPVVSSGYSWSDEWPTHVLVVRVQDVVSTSDVICADSASIGVAPIVDADADTVDLDGFEEIYKSSYARPFVANDHDTGGPDQDMIGEMVIVGSFDAARTVYLGILSGINSFEGWESDGSFDNWVETDFRDAWEGLEASLNGKTHIVLPVYSLANLAGGKPFTLDLSAETLTRSDGQVIQLSITRA